MAYVEIAALDGSGSFKAYRADPAGAPKGAIVVIQEIFGVNAGIRSLVDRWAGLGYIAFAHDLFWRDQPGIELNLDVPGDLEKAFGAMGRFDTDKGITDIEATIRFARAAVGGGKVGVVGYCLGGKLAYLTATRTDSDATVAYYGMGVDDLLGEAHAIAKPLLMHFAENDHYIPADARAKIHAALDGNAHVTIEEYAGVDHGFATPVGSRRDETQAQAADAKTTAFFAQHIG